MKELMVIKVVTERNGIDLLKMYEDCNSGQDNIKEDIELIFNKSIINFKRLACNSEHLLRYEIEI
jgi:hypothetical protein